MIHPKWPALLSVLLVALFAGDTFSQSTPAVTPPERKPLFEIRTDGDYIGINIFSEPLQPTATGKLSAITRDKDGIQIGTARFEKDSLRVGSAVIAYDMIFDVQFEQSESKLQVVTFLQRETVSPGSTKLRGNRRSFADSVSVPAGDFVRGMVFSVDGPVTIEGEVNRSVVSLFQDISLKPGSVVRGNVITLTGKLHIDRASAVYGESYGASISHRGKQRYSLSFSDKFSVGARFSYNRVDGAAPMGYMKLNNPDSTTPELSFALGYAFASKRLRLHATAKQFLSRKTPILVGAEFYRGLQPSGDFNISTNENTLAALLAKEDFHEYYERVGGSIWAAVYPNKTLLIQLGYRYEETNWLDAHKNLWSLFGGSKCFPRNYRYADSTLFANGIKEIDSSVNGELELAIQYSTRKEKFFDASSWLVSASLWYGVPDFGSDFDYVRYEMLTARMQRLHEGGSLFINYYFGLSENELPLHRQFFTGGPVSLRGYKPNRIIGNGIGMLNFEFREKIPTTPFALSAFYDFAMNMIRKEDSTGTTELNGYSYEDVGLSFYLFNEKGILSIGWPVGVNNPDGKKPVYYARINFGF